MTGKCLEWVRDHLALDEIGNYLSEVVDSIPPGAGGVIFTPWLHGNRCPFEDPDAAGIFFNVKLETGKSQLIRAVVEGICYHLHWMLECQDRKIQTSDPIRFFVFGKTIDTNDLARHDEEQKNGSSRILGG